MMSFHSMDVSGGQTRIYVAGFWMELQQFQPLQLGIIGIRIDQMETISAEWCHNVPIIDGLMVSNTWCCLPKDRMHGSLMVTFFDMGWGKYWNHWSHEKVDDERSEMDVNSDLSNKYRRNMWAISNNAPVFVNFEGILMLWVRYSDCRLPLCSWLAPAGVYWVRCSALLRWCPFVQLHVYGFIWSHRAHRVPKSIG